jgi:hypothetical protein
MKLSKPGLYGDGGGLTIQITATGAKSWLFRDMVAGKPFGMGLGPTAYRESGRCEAEGAGRAEAAYRRHQSFGSQEAEADRRCTGRRQDDDIRPVLRRVHSGA